MQTRIQNEVKAEEESGNVTEEVVSSAVQSLGKRKYSEPNQAREDRTQKRSKVVEGHDAFT